MVEAHAGGDVGSPLDPRDLAELTSATYAYRFGHGTKDDARRR